MEFAGVRVLVTGGSRGIGRAAVAELVSRGARVAVNGRSDESTLAGIVCHAESYQQNLYPAAGDIATVDGCRSVVTTAVAQLGGLDVLICSAGVGGNGSMLDVDEQSWDQTFDVNLKGTFFCAQAAVPHLQASGGNIVNVASDAGLIGESGLSVYCASKGGVVNLTRALALELAPDIRVNCVCPGYVDTDMVRRDGINQSAEPAAAEQRLKEYAPLQRIAQPAEVAQAIAYLASPTSKFVTGAALSIDGGTTAGHRHHS